MSLERANLVFIPLPTMSHLVVAVKTAKLLADRDERLSITVLIMKLPINDPKISSYTNNSSNSRINFVELQENKSIDVAELMKSPKNMLPRLIESQKDPIREAVIGIMDPQKPVRLAGLFVDIFCTTMVDVAKELGAPAYVFFTCGAASLGIMFRLESLRDEENQDITAYQDTDAVVSIPTYVNPVPAKVWPSALLDKEGGFLNLTKKLREVNGIVLNTFYEFESHAISALSADDKIPAIYPVGPIIQDEAKENEENKQKRKEILAWLD